MLMLGLTGTSALWASLGHFVIDVYASFYPLIYPLLAQRLRLSVAEVGLLATTYSLASALPLPVVGYLIDRVRRWPGTSVPVLAGGLLLLLIGYVRTLEQALLIVALAGLGSAALHPFAVTVAARVDSRQRADALSLFIFAGNLGVTVGPLLGGLLVGYLGQGATFAALLPIGLAAWWLRRSEERERHIELPADGGRPAPTWGFLRRFAPLGLLVGVRGAVFFATNAYLPLYLTQRGWTLGGAGSFQAALLAGVAIGGLSGGWIARRFSTRGLVLTSSLLVAPTLSLAVYVQTPLWPLQAFLAGWLFGLANPLTVGLAQEMNPGAVGTASGMIMTAGFMGIVSGVQAVGWTGQALGLGIVLVWWPALLVPGVALAALAMRAGDGESGLPIPGTGTMPRGRDARRQLDGGRKASEPADGSDWGDRR